MVGTAVVGSSSFGPSAGGGTSEGRAETAGRGGALRVGAGAGAGAGAAAGVGAGAGAFLETDGSWSD